MNSIKRRVGIDISNFNDFRTVQKIIAVNTAMAFFNVLNRLKLLIDKEEECVLIQMLINYIF